ncbi:phage minor tail protein L, partial [Enterobacter roggenkampii]|nr:phage minor tail protein L [Enterobacter roggenkampii]
SERIPAAAGIVNLRYKSCPEMAGQDHQLHSLCTWCIRNKYRTGDGCDYAGTNYFDKNNNPVSDPSLDECSGTLTACKLRFGENNELSFGGFPGTSLIRS